MSILPLFWLFSAWGWSQSTCQPPITVFNCPQSYLPTPATVTGTEKEAINNLIRTALDLAKQYRDAAVEYERIKASEEAKKNASLSSRLFYEIDKGAILQKQRAQMNARAKMYAAFGEALHEAIPAYQLVPAKTDFKSEATNANGLRNLKPWMPRFSDLEVADEKDGHGRMRTRAELLSEADQSVRGGRGGGVVSARTVMADDRITILWQSFAKPDSEHPEDPSLGTADADMLAGVIVHETTHWVQNARDVARTAHFLTPEERFRREEEAHTAQANFLKLVGSPKADGIMAVAKIYGDRATESRDMHYTDDDIVRNHYLWLPPNWNKSSPAEGAFGDTAEPPSKDSTDEELAKVKKRQSELAAQVNKENEARERAVALDDIAYKACMDLDNLSTRNFDSFTWSSDSPIGEWTSQDYSGLTWEQLRCLYDVFARLKESNAKGMSPDLGTIQEIARRHGAYEARKERAASRRERTLAFAKMAERACADPGSISWATELGKLTWTGEHSAEEDFTFLIEALGERWNFDSCPYNVLRGLVEANNKYPDLQINSYNARQDAFREFARWCDPLHTNLIWLADKLCREPTSVNQQEVAGYLKCFPDRNPARPHYAGPSCSRDLYLEMADLNAKSEWGTKLRYDWLISEAARLKQAYAPKPPPPQPGGGGGGYIPPEDTHPQRPRCADPDPITGIIGCPQ